MRGYRWLAAPLLITTIMIIALGCHGTGSRNSVSAPEPGLSGTIEPKGSVAEATPAPGVSYVDRHPLFAKPREYWDSSGDNKIVKAAAATFIGVPAGLFGEVKQIVVGAPPQTVR